MANEKTLIRGAYVLTMDEELGTIHDGDVRIEGDRITAVGRELAADGAEVIDGTDCIVLPGFVDTHRHMWGAMLRGCACYGDLGTYFHDVVFTYGANYTPDDTYASSRFGLAEAVDAGITTLHAWEHNLQTRGHAEAAIAALRESGLRGRFSYGFSSDPNAGSSFAQGSETLDLEHVPHSSAANSHVPGTCSTSASPVVAPSTPSRRSGSRNTRGRGSKACHSRPTR
jgi:cytosine/adenosine deaminase-related metal-dependent hydrolase